MSNIRNNITDFAIRQMYSLPGECFRRYRTKATNPN